MFSSCGGIEFKEDRRSEVGDPNMSGGSVQLNSGTGQKGRTQEDSICTSTYLSGHDDKRKDSGYGGDSKTCPQPPTSTQGKPVPPANPPTPAPPPPVPPPQPTKEFPLVLLSGLVCQKTPKELFNLAQFVGSQSKDQFQFLINAGMTGSLTIDQLVIFGSIAKSLTEVQITDWKSRTCANNVPIPSCQATPGPATGKGSQPTIDPKCLPTGGKVVAGSPSTMEPKPVIDASEGKGQT
jgi:hypothetical protein